LRNIEPPVFASYDELPKHVAPLLAEAAAPGAPALRCWPYGLDSGYGSVMFGVECVLPLTDPPPAADGGDWLTATLEQVTRNGRPLPSVAQQLLAETLAPGPRRADGLPGYRPCGPDRGSAETYAALSTLSPGNADDDYDHAAGRTVFRECVRYETREVALATGDGRTARARATSWRRHARTDDVRRGERNAAPIRALLAAVAFDLAGAAAATVGGPVLGLRPNPREHHPEHSYAWRAGSSPYRYRQQGRAMLAQLGCWPWVHATDGKLPRTWRRQEAFLAPLTDWAGSGAGL